MKILLSLIISGALVVSGFGQTRNVLVGTNNAVVQPTNFWSADASNARVGLGLGTAATNPASAFQSSSSVLSNLASSNAVDITNIRSTNIVGVLSVSQGGTGATNAADARISIGLGSAATNPSSAFQSSSSALSNLSLNNGASLTNIQAANIVGAISFSNIPSFNFTNIAGTLSVARGGTGSTNAANARQNLGSTTLGDAVFTATNAAAARTVIGATTVGSSVFTLANPSAITFLRLNADNTASALSASDFRTALSLGTAATNPAAAFQPSSTSLSNLANNNGGNLTNITISNVVGLLATNGSAAGLTNFPESLLVTNGNGAGLTNLTAANIAGTVGLASNITGTIAVFNGGTGATNAGGARTNLGLGWSALTNTNTANFRSAIGLNQSWLTNTNSPLFPDSNGRLVTPVTIYDAVNDYALLTLPLDAGQTVDPIVMNVQSGAWDTSNNRTALGLGVSNTPIFNGVNLVSTNDTTMTNQIFAVSQNLNINRNNVNFVGFSGSPNRIDLSVPVSFGVSPSSIQAATTRTNLGLGATWLTNTNNPVFVNTNGEVVSPTNFWDVAPIQTTVQNFLPSVNATNAATNARTLYVYSMALSTTGVTHVITLPTNTATKNGDEVTVIHMAPTSSVTAIRQLGQTNNLITINKTDEAVKFIYENNAWTNFHNISFVEPIQFSGTNASANTAESRTNFGLGWSALTNTSVTNFQKDIFHTNTAPSNIGGNLGSIAAWIEIVASNGVTYKIPAYTNIP